MSEDENLETERADICFKVVENMYFMSNNFLEKINSGNKFSFATIKL